MTVKLIRWPKVNDMTNLSKSYLYLLIKNNQFVKPVKQGRATLFVLSEVENWIESRITDRDQASK